MRFRAPRPFPRPPSPLSRPLTRPPVAHQPVFFAHTARSYVEACSAKHAPVLQPRPLLPMGPKLHPLLALHAMKRMSTPTGSPRRPRASSSSAAKGAGALPLTPVGRPQSPSGSLAGTPTSRAAKRPSSPFQLPAGSRASPDASLRPRSPPLPSRAVQPSQPILSWVRALSSAAPAVNLRLSAIDSRAAELLAASLATNESIRSLDIRGNSIGGGGGLALAEALRLNTTLTELDISVNHLPGSGVCIAS